MTAWRIAPVHTRADWGAGQDVEVPSRAELLLQNERLKADLETARLDAANWQAMWSGAHKARAAAEMRADRAARVLSSIERFNPVVAGLVAAARREIWRLDE